MTVAMAAFTVNDTFMKSLSDDMGFMQAIFLRGLLVTLALGVAVAGNADAAAASAGGTAGSSCCATSARLRPPSSSSGRSSTPPLANMTAILQAVPLTVTLAGALFLGEPVGWRRLAAILVGFFGVMLIVRPGHGGLRSLFDQRAAVGFRRDAARPGDAADCRPRRPSLSVAFLGGSAVTLCAGIGMLGQDWAAARRRCGDRLSLGSAVPA